jgi:hypothetical protein
MSLRRCLSAFALLSLFSSAALASDYCDGYKEGYKQGYCYGKYGCIPPIPPICPIPNIGESTYQHGYNRGVIEGQRAG